MPLASFDATNITRPLAEPFGHHSGRSFYPLEQRVDDVDETGDEFTPMPTSTMVMIVGASTFACLGLIGALAWLGNSLN